MSATEKRFDHIANIPLHYAREPIAGYGTRGQQMMFFGNVNFHRKLEEFVQELIDVCPFGAPEVIVTAGVYVNKPKSWHRFGRAFDLDAIFWKDKSFITKHYLQDKAFYLGIEALLRKRFGTVLQYVYDRRHEDHFHVDDGNKVDFRTDWESYTCFAQTSVNVLFGKHVEEDGMWGPETSTAVTQVFEELGISAPITTIANWIDYLDACAARAFAITAPVHSPADLLQKIYETINTANIDELEAKRIEGSVTAFAMHEKVAEFLEE